MEPEANGCIERFHRSMDNEFILKIKNYDNLDDIQEELQRFTIIAGFSLHSFYTMAN